MWAGQYAAQAAGAGVGCGNAGECDLSMAVKRYAGHLRVDARAQKELRRVMKMLKCEV
jgi:hypothetical protein